MGYPDWQDYAQWRGAVLLEAVGEVLGANASWLSSPAAMPNFRTLVVGFDGNQPADLRISFEPPQPSSGAFATYMFEATVDLDSVGVLAVPAHGDIGSIEVIAPAAGLTFDLVAYGVNLDGAFFSSGHDNILFHSAANAIGIGAVEEVALPFYAGRAKAFMSAGAFPMTFTIRSYDKTGALIGIPFQRTIAAGGQEAEFILPPRRNTLEVTNGSGAVTTWFATLVAEPLR